MTMMFKITIKYKYKDELCKVIKISLNEKINVLKDGKQIAICLSGCENTYLYKFNEDKVYGYEIARIL